MSLPDLTCPACGASMSLEIALGHQGARQALMAMANLHPSGSRLQLLSLRYVGLFAPAKQKMRLDRVAAVLEELHALFAPGTVEFDGITHPAPLPYWMDAMEAMLARQTEMELPLRNHNYLRKVVSGNLKREAAQAERKREDTLTGRTQVGGLEIDLLGPAQANVDDFPTMAPQSIGQRRLQARAAQAYVMPEHNRPRPQLPG